MLIVGSSLVVNPAAKLPQIARQSGGKIAIINRTATPLDSMADLNIRAEAGPTLSAVADAQAVPREQPLPTLHDPVAISILGISIRWYAVFILTGIVVSILVIQELARRRGMDPEFVLDVAPWVVFAAIIGARLYYLALKWRYYTDHPGQAI